ncbi:MAG TPA: amino acid permease [Terriglobia bacterium]|nr:amino acid permease [Terriglobia bacterium]
MPKFQTEVRLSREMSLMDATLIGVGAMIGAGIFVLTGIAAGVAGPALILAFALNGVVTLFTAMSYAELGSCYHDAGGGYLWAKEGLPRWNGFLSGWMSWFAHAVACSVYALGFGAYFEYVLRELGYNVPHWSFLAPQKLLAVFVAVLFAYVNFRGASETGKVGNIVTGTKIVVLLIFIAFGLGFVFHQPQWESAGFTPFMPHGWSGVVKAMGLTFIAFEGYEIIAQSSEEIKDPKKNIPKAVFYSLIIVIPIYLLVAFVALGGVHPPHGMTPWAYLGARKELALVEVARHFFKGGGLMVLVAGLISTMSALNATVFSSSRVAFAMGRDRNFPSFFSRVHAKKNSPHWAIFLSLLIVVFMAVSLPIEVVATAADVMFLLIFLQVNLALITLRKKRPDLDRGFWVPFFPWISIVGIVCNFALALYMFTYSLRAWAVTGVWIVAGLLIYKFYAASREMEHERKVRALDRLERKEYRVLACVSDQESLPSLAGLAFAVARKHNAEVIFLNVVEVEENEPLRAGLRESAAAQELLDGACWMALEHGVPVRSIVRVSHRISQGIVDTALEEECNLIVQARDKHPTFFERFFSTAIDMVVQNAPSETAVLHGTFPEEGVRRILIPFAPDIHTRLAVEMARAFKDYYHCSIRIAVVFEPEIPMAERGEKLEDIRKLVHENNLEAEVDAIHDSDVVRGILQKAREADLILMAARTGDFLQLLLGKSLSREITEGAPCAVLWVKEFEERTSFLASLFKPAHQEAEP